MQEAKVKTYLLCSNILWLPMVKRQTIELIEKKAVDNDSRINSRLINTFITFSFLFMNIILKSSLTINGYSELFILMIIIIRKLIEKEKTREKYWWKHWVYQKNHSGYIYLTHSSMLDREHSIIRIIHLSFWHCPLENN